MGVPCEKSVNLPHVCTQEIQQNGQIFLGLLIAGGGNPIGYEIFEGNIFEGHTFVPVLQNVEKKYALGKPVVVADAGLLSDDNRKLLEGSGYKYILGARIKNLKEVLKEKILSFKLQNDQTDIPIAYVKTHQN